MSIQDRFDDKVSEINVDLFRLAGHTPFCADGNKSLALRRDVVKPLLDDPTNKLVVVDCTGIDNMTDSFANAFFGPLCADFFESGRLKFKGCTPLVKSFILSAWEMEMRKRNRA